MNFRKAEMTDWRPNDLDQEIFARELQSFVPNRIFDFHAHLYEKTHLGGSLSTLCASGPPSVGMGVYKSRIRDILPRCEVHGLFFAYPAKDIDFDMANSFVCHETKHDSESRCLMLVHPEMDPDFIRQAARTEGFVGLKCYHCYSDCVPTFNAEIPSFLPDEQVRLAHEEGFTIVLHIVRPRALADPLNQEVIRRYASCYPDARFILAHAARGFNAYHTLEGIECLRGLRNVWCDTAAVTEEGSLEAVIRTMGADRLLYGSDFPVTHLRGRCVALGDSFIWLSEKNTNFNSPGRVIEPTLVGLEALRALKSACLNLRLSDSQVEGIFRRNSENLLGISANFTETGPTKIRTPGH